MVFNEQFVLSKYITQKCTKIRTRYPILRWDKKSTNLCIESYESSKSGRSKCMRKYIWEIYKSHTILIQPIYMAMSSGMELVHLKPSNSCEFCVGVCRTRIFDLNNHFSRHDRYIQCVAIIFIMVLYECEYLRLQNYNIWSYINVHDKDIM